MLRQIFYFSLVAFATLYFACTPNTTTPPQTPFQPLPGDVTYLYIKDQQTNQALSFGFDTSSDLSKIVLSTSVKMPSGETSVVKLIIPRSELQGILIQETSPNTYTLSKGGESLPISVNMTAVPGPTSKDSTFTGTYTDSLSGKMYQFVSVTDPGPAVVIIGIGAAVCLGVLLIEAITTDCDKMCTTACGARGVKSCEAHITFGFSLDPLKLGCSKDCVVHCN